MIYINGQKSNLELNQFANLEELIIATSESCNSAQQIITEVHLNDELFQELYPHQAEDIDISEVQKIEFTSVSYTKMACDIVEELFKVTASIRLAASQASESLRRGDDNEALMIIKDMIDVTRNFITMLSYFQTDFNAPTTPEAVALFDKFEKLITEINDTMENEDWILVADLLEFEISPCCSEWDEYLKSLRFYFGSETENISQ